MHLHEPTLNLLNLEHFPTDVDEQFIENFIELYLPTGYESLRKIEVLCRQQTFVSEVLLAIYIQMARRMAKHEGASVFENDKVIKFLAVNESLLINGSSPILHALYGLLADMESLEVQHPFRFDLETKIYDALIAENTSIAVRASVETLAIVRMENMFGVHREQSRNDGAARYLLWRFVDALVEADYAPVLDSIARVLMRFSARFFDADSGDAAARLLQKAKQTNRVGLQFARLTATLCSSLLFKIDLDGVFCGFLDSQSKALVLSELFEQNKNTRKYDEAELADMIISAAGNRLNFVTPILQFVNFTSKEDAMWFLDKMLPSLRSSRFCTEEAVCQFIAFLVKIDGDNFEILPKAVETLSDRILQTPRLLKAFTVLKCPPFNVILKRTQLGSILSSAINEHLIVPFSAAENISPDSAKSRQDEDRWEDRDSALEILNYCDVHLLDCDFSQLANCAFRLAAEDRSDFVRKTARRFLLRTYCPVEPNVSISLSPSEMPHAGESSQLKLPPLTEEQQQQLTTMHDEEASEAESTRRAQLVHQTRRNALQAEIDDVIATLHNGCVLGDGVDDCISKECY